MKKVSDFDDPDMLPEYDFLDGVRGKYVERYARSQVKGASAAPFPVAGSDALLDSLRRSASIPTDAPSEVFIGGIGGATWCNVRADGTTRLFGNHSPCIVEIGSTIAIKFEELVGDQHIEVSILGPDGVRIVDGLRQDEWGGWDWTPLPGAAVGRYKVTGVQSGSERFGHIDVVRAQSPVTSVIPNAVLPEQPVMVTLAGYLPNDLVKLRLYRRIGYGPVVVDAVRDLHGDMTIYRFAGELRPVRVDEHGEAIYFISTQAVDESGTYVVETLPEARKSGAFGDRVFRLLPRGASPSELSKAGQSHSG